MSRSIGLSSFLLASPFSDADVPGQFARVREHGFDVVEVCVEDPALLTAEVITHEADACGLAVSVCGAFGPERDVSAPDAAARDRAVGYLQGCVDLAAAVGSPHVAGPMYATTGRTALMPDAQRTAQRERAAASLREVADHAARRGVRLAIEALNRFETDLVNTVEQGLALCDLVERDNVGLLLDTFHMNIEERSPADAIRRAGDRCFHVQVCENDRGTPGAGHVPWPQIRDALDDIGYAGSVVIESFLPTVAEIARAVSLWRPVAESPDALARDGLAFLRGLGI